MYLSDHPLRRIAATLQARVDTSISELGAHLDGLIVQVGGCIRDVRAFVPRKSTTGQRMAFLQLEDLTGSCEVVVFNRVFEEVAELLRPDAVVVIRGKVESGRPSPNGAVDDEDREAEPSKIRADAIFALDDARLVAWRRNSTVHFRLAPDQHHLVGPLHQAIAEHRGDAPVVIHVESAESIDDIALDEGFAVEPGPGLERTVEALLGAGLVPPRDAARARPGARDVGCGAPRLRAGSRRPRPRRTARDPRSTGRGTAGRRSPRHRRWPRRAGRRRRTAAPAGR